MRHGVHAVVSAKAWRNKRAPPPPTPLLRQYPLVCLPSFTDCSLSLVSLSVAHCALGRSPAASLHRSFESLSLLVNCVHISLADNDISFDYQLLSSLTSAASGPFATGRTRL